MIMRNNAKLALVFFCSLGSVYAGPVFGADGDLEAIPTAPAAQKSIFEQPQDAADADLTQKVSVGTFGKISITVDDLDLAKVLQLLSIQSQRNIIASRNVTGNVSATLYDVDFHQALDAVLHTNGFGYREKGNFIYVYTQQELDEMDKAQRKPTTKIIRLNYINATDAQAFVTPLLSAAGAISVTGEAPSGMQPTLSDAGANSFAHTDTLVIRDFEENVVEILDVIKALDIRPKQVLIEATIMQARLTDNTAFGVDFAIFTDLSMGDFSTPLGAVNELITGAPVAPSGADRNTGTVINSTVGNVQSGKGGLKVGFVSNDAAVFVRALDQVTDTSVLANPKLLVLNRQRAELLVGEKLGYISTTQTDTSATQSVEFLEVGTQLTVRPFIADDDFIRLELCPSVSAGETVVVEGLVIPNETTQELTTNVIIKNAQTVILGGLFKEDTTTDRNQIPVAGNLPLVGPAFQGRDDSVKRNEVIFLIKPTIMKDESLALAGDNAARGVQTISAAHREGLLPWSTTKLAAAHVRDALKHMDSGNKDKALYCANQALALNPTMVEALRVRELAGGKTYFNDRGILDSSINRMIDDAADAVKLDPTPAPGSAPTPGSASAPGSAPVTQTPPGSDAAPAALDQAREDGGQAQAVESLEPVTQAPAPQAAATQTSHPESAQASHEAPVLEQAEAPSPAPATAAQLDAQVADAQAQADKATEASVNVLNVIDEFLGGDGQSEPSAASIPVVEVDPATVP
jgi:type IV pilus assembly protein PilQ